MNILTLNKRIYCNIVNAQNSKYLLYRLFSVKKCLYKMPDFYIDNLVYRNYRSIYLPITIAPWSGHEKETAIAMNYIDKYFNVDINSNNNPQLFSYPDYSRRIYFDTYINWIGINKDLTIINNNATVFAPTQGEYALFRITDFRDQFLCWFWHKITK